VKNQKLFISNDEYRKMEGVANSDLLMVKKNPSDYPWSKVAPVDNSKVATKDFGTALHTALLEPENFDDDVFVSSVAGRTAKTFIKEVNDSPDKVVLTEVEAEQIRIMQASALCHPAMNLFLTAEGDRESSIFAYDNEFEIWLKCRPDIDAFEKHGFIGDLKSTASISDWREPVEWKNPLFKFDYGHTAAFYLYTMSKFYGKPVETYKFGLSQKTIELGKYQQSVFTITRGELETLGFWDDMLNNLGEYSRRLKSDDWVYEEVFPIFGRDDMEVTFDD
jgi:exodeoxyribonuclease VIII